MERRQKRLSQPSAASSRNRQILRRIILFWLVLGDGLAADFSSTRHWALFNTTCARCHEAQCSGRLSLGSGDMPSRAHVERYAGALTEDLHQQLVRYLQHMKEFCGFAAVPIDIGPRNVWSEAELALFRTPDGVAYFIPLGELKAGNYRLQARLRGAEWTAQVISFGFDVLAETGSRDTRDKLQVDFSTGGGTHYLRVVGRGVLEVQELRLASSLQSH